MASITAQEIDQGRRGRVMRWMLAISILAVLVWFCQCWAGGRNTSYSLGTIFRFSVAKKTQVRLFFD
jgi:hypothetical protein